MNLKKHTIGALLGLLFSGQLMAQVVDESINAVQVGFFGAWLHNESKMAPNWALRSEVGFEAPVASGLIGAIDYPVFVPTLSLTPKWYYNSRKRQGNSLNYFHNSSNYAAVGLLYIPTFFKLSPHDGATIDGGFFLVPTWGFQRNISYRLNYELGLGVGVDVHELFFTEEQTTDAVIRVQLRLGYKFGKQAFQEP
ncbi:hypothetical protein [Maribacter sp. 2307ULW6-5]|uniref:hypothetical protein n=1 Tax=Maribacter sp. 2307ULW6-5 TaxID=3386275 RepID=UPI0039BCA3A8